MHTGPDFAAYDYHFLLGVISREDAEVLLDQKPVHSFLVRLSEKIWGYAISYKAEDRCKHYLVDINENGYQFFGTNQLEHSTLSQLIMYHKVSKSAVSNPRISVASPGYKGIPYSRCIRKSYATHFYHYKYIIQPKIRYSLVYNHLISHQVCFTARSVDDLTLLPRWYY